MRLLFLMLFLVFTSCSQPNPEAMIPMLEGYWEIQQVTLTDGAIKVYEVNSNVDFIALTSDSTGIRKKLAPKIDGGFAQTNSAESFRIKNVDNSLILEYKTPYSSWQETVKIISAEQLVVRNKEGLEYQYKKHVPTNLLSDE